jgi:hypothetical protein
MADYIINKTGLQLDAKLTPAYAGIHVHDASTAQSIPTGATYTKLIAFTNNSVSFGAVADAANDLITINTAGVYKIDSSFSMSSGTNNVTFFFTLFSNDVEIDSIHFTRKISTAVDVGSASFSGLISIPAVPVNLDVRVRHNNVGAINLTVSYANFSAIKIDE